MELSVNEVTQRINNKLTFSMATVYSGRTDAAEKITIRSASHATRYGRKFLTIMSSITVSVRPEK